MVDRYSKWCDVVLYDFQAALFVAVSPDPDNVSETVSSLTFGSNARQVALGQAKQNVRRGPAVGGAWGMEDI